MHIFQKGLTSYIQSCKLGPECREEGFKNRIRNVSVCLPLQPSADSPKHLQYHRSSCVLFPGCWQPGPVKSPCNLQVTDSEGTTVGICKQQYDITALQQGNGGQCI